MAPKASNGNVAMVTKKPAAHNVSKKPAAPLAAPVKATSPLALVPSAMTPALPPPQQQKTEEAAAQRLRSSRLSST